MRSRAVLRGLASSPGLRLMPLLAVLACFATAAAKTLNVFAASSLTEAFTELALDYERARPDVEVSLNFAGSSTLSLQIIQGAPADLFVSADVAQVVRVDAHGLIAAPGVRFASNRLVLVVPSGSPVAGLAELTRAGLKLVLAGPEVPAGRYARVAFERYAEVADPGFLEAVLANVVSEEPNVRLVAAKVALGEADAGIVYATDAAAFEALSVIELPPEAAPDPTYVAAVLREAAQPQLAAAFISLLTSHAGRAVLRAHGFTAPVP